MNSQLKLVVWGVATPRTMRPHWLLREMGIDHQIQPIQSRSGETQRSDYLRLNPKQKIPCLQDGDFVLTESYAMLRYLRDKYDLLPYADDQLSLTARARREEWASFIQMELDATSLYVMRRHRDLPDIYGEAQAAVDSSKAYFLKQLNAVESRIAGREHLWGSAFSEVDILMVTCLDWAVFYGIELPAAASDYRQTMVQRPAYQEVFKLNYQV